MSESATQDVGGKLAAVLSRAAAEFGIAVPAFRFHYLEQTKQGIPLAQLPPVEQLREMWTSRFPGGPIRPMHPEAVGEADFPLIWIHRDGQQVVFVRGRLSQGSMVGDRSDGKFVTLDPQAIAEGQLLRVEPDRAALETRPTSASDWFVYAVRKYRRVFLEGVFATFVISSLALFSALYTMQVYDRVVPTKGYSTLWVLTVGVLLAIGLEFMMKQVRTYIVDRASKRIDLELSSVFFGKALSIRMDARPATVGTFASQIRHFESVRQFMTSSTLFILADAPFALFFVGVIAMLAGPVAFVPLIMIPVAIGVGLLAVRNIREYTSRHMRESNEKNGLLIEAIDGAESIKATGGSWKLEERYRNLTESLADNELRLKHLNSRSSYLTQSVQQLNYVGLIAAGAIAITNGSLSMGALVACSIIAGRALTPISHIPSLINQWCNAKIALEALDKIMAMPSDRQPGVRLTIPEQCTGRLEMSEVRFGYSPDLPALEVSALTLQAGERVAVIGAVGSGKSTLVKLLSGLYKPASGRLFLDGLEMEQLAPEFLREHIGYLPQDVRLFNGTLRENLALGLPTPSDGKILEAAAITGLDRVIQAHPKGLEIPIAEGGRGLSGGQRQLVGLTRLLLARPKVWLLDEPTAAMDASLEAHVMRHLFDEVSRESLLVVVTHKVAMLPYVDRVIMLDRGRIVVDDARDKVLSLMRQPAVRHRNVTRKTSA